MGPDVLSFLPEIVVAGTALLVLGIDLFLAADRKALLLWLSLLGLAGALVATVWANGAPATAFGGFVIADALSSAFNCIALSACALALLMSVDYLRQRKLEQGEYYALALFSTLGAMVMGKSDDLLLLFLGFEILSIPLYILVAWFRHSPQSQEAGMKYFLLGAFSSAFLLYGIAMVYGMVGSTQLSAVLQYANGAAIGPLFYLGVGLLLVGLSFKAAIVPFQAWAPDAYQGAPTPVTAFMSVMAKVAAFAGLIRITGSVGLVADHWAPLLAGLGALTVVVGTLMALVQGNLKRLLAYSSIAHAGYLMLALVPQGGAGLPSLLFYLLAYGLMNLGVFAVVISIEGRQERVSLSDYAGLAAHHPWLAALMTLFLLSLAGLPPTAGFIAKLYLFNTLMQSGYWSLTLLGVLTSVVSVYAYWRIVYAMYMKPAEAPPLAAFAAPTIIAIGIAALGVLQWGIFPASILHLLQQSLPLVR